MAAASPGGTKAPEGTGGIGHLLPQTRQVTTSGFLSSRMTRTEDFCYDVNECMLLHAALLLAAPKDRI